MIMYVKFREDVISLEGLVPYVHLEPYLIKQWMEFH